MHPCVREHPAYLSVVLPANAKFYLGNACFHRFLYRLFNLRLVFGIDPLPPRFIGSREGSWLEAIEFFDCGTPYVDVFLEPPFKGPALARLKRQQQVLA